MSIVCRLTSLHSACRGCSTEAVEEKQKLIGNDALSGTLFGHHALFGHDALFGTI
jgi:hypothetical protein